MSDDGAGSAPAAGGGLADARPRTARPAAVALVSLAGVCVLQSSLITQRNFGGFDEWVFLWLTSRGIVDSPYSNRPLNLLWTSPAPWLTPHHFAGFSLLHGTYLVATGLLLYALCRRLRPADAGLAVLAGTLAVAWVPADMSRLTTVQMIHTGFAFSALLGVVLFAESWVRDRPLALAAGAVLCVVAARAYEGVLGVLACAPLVLPLLARPWRCRRALAWAGAWWAACGAAAGLVLRGALDGEGMSYQLQVMGGIDPHPYRVLARLGRQLAFHLVPLVATPPALAATPTALAAAAVLVLALAMLRSPAPGTGGRTWPLAALGATLAVAGYLPVVLSPTVTTPTRTQFVPAPGVALLVAALATAAAARAPRRAGPWVRALLGAWVVAAGTGRIAAHQQAWESLGFWPQQSACLDGLLRLAPDLRPHTLVLLADERGAWPAPFAFRHAVDYVYEGRAVGQVFGASDLLYGFSIEADGTARVEPRPVIQVPWGVSPTTYRPDEMVLVRLRPDGGVEMLERWPSVLPPLPAGARYDPRQRVAPLPPGRAALPTARILGP